MIIMDFLNITETNELWTIPVYAKQFDSYEEEMFINTMACDIFERNRDYIIRIASKIIDAEIKKHKNMDLRKKILIKNQILNNINHNVINIVLNLAKEIYDNNIKPSLKKENDLINIMKEEESFVIFDFTV